MSKKRARKGDEEGVGELLQLVVVKQTGIRDEEFFRATGVKDSVCVVVKTHVFRVEIGTADRRSLPDGIVWSSELAYDGEERPRKLVPVVKASPVSAVQKPSASAWSVSFACKLTVLTSQHEGLFFRIVFHGTCPDGTVLSVESHPIRVISKPDSSAKKKRSAAANEEEEEIPAVPEPKVAKLTDAEKVLAEVSQLQLEAHELLRRLQHYGQLRVPDPAVVQDGAIKHLDFGACFSDLLEAYGRLVGQQERTRRVRHVSGLKEKKMSRFFVFDISIKRITSQHGSSVSAARAHCKCIRQWWRWRTICRTVCLV